MCVCWCWQSLTGQPKEALHFLIHIFTTWKMHILTLTLTNLQMYKSLNAVRLLPQMCLCNDKVSRVLQNNWPATHPEHNALAVFSPPPPPVYPVFPASLHHHTPSVSWASSFCPHTYIHTESFISFTCSSTFNEFLSIPLCQHVFSVGKHM